MESLQEQTLLVLAPHPDDEVIGCGGLITKIKNSGGKVFVLFFTVGDTKDFSKRGISKAIEREKEVEDVSKFLRYDGYHIAFPGDKYHLKLDLLGQKALMDLIERESTVSIEKVKPTIVAFPLSTSYNQDHRTIAIATHAALRPAQRSTKHFVLTVLSYEEPQDAWILRNQPEPNFFVPLSKNEIDVKLSALKLYKSQLRPLPNPRALETIKSSATLRGAQCGSNFAEAFTAYRTIF